MGYGDDEGINRSYSEVVTEAKKKDVDIVVADDRTLQIDIDDGLNYVNWTKNSEFLLKDIGIERWEIKESASGYPHRHITVYLKEPADVWKRIALQACLGSHLMREALNAHRVLTGNDCPILFFEKKGTDNENNRIVEIEDEI